MKAFYFLSAVAELGISNDAYALFTKDAIIDGATFGGSILFGTIPNGSDRRLFGAIPRTGATL